jgi:2-keto-4-pentenoate hydratase
VSTAFGPAWADPRVRDGMREVLTQRATAIAAGDRALGWKLAFGAPQTREALGLPGPVIGYLTDATERRSGATVACANWAQPAFEAELAIYLGRDVAAGEDPEAAAEAISGIGPAIELADVDRSPDDLAEVIAADIYHRGVILRGGGPGSPNLRTGAAVADLRARVTRDREPLVAVDDPQSVVGRPGEIVAYVAAYLGAFGHALRRGEVIISGSVMPFVTVAPGQRLDYELDPIGKLAVALA